MKTIVYQITIILSLFAYFWFVIAVIQAGSDMGIIFQVSHSVTSDTGFYWMDINGKNRQLLFNAESLGVDEHWQFGQYDIYENYIALSAYTPEPTSDDEGIWLVSINEGIQAEIIARSGLFPTFSPNGSLIGYAVSPNDDPLNMDLLVYDRTTNTHHFILNKSDISAALEQINQVVHFFDIGWVSENELLLSAMVLLESDNGNLVNGATLVLITFNGDFLPTLEYLSPSVVYMEVISSDELVYDVNDFDYRWRIYRYNFRNEQQSIFFNTENHPIFGGNVHQYPYISGYDVQGDLMTLGVDDDIYVADVSSGQLFNVTQTDNTRETRPQWFVLPNEFIGGYTEPSNFKEKNLKNL